MATVTTPFTIAVNKTFKGRAPRAKVTITGSFISLRIEDKDGVVSMKLFDEMTRHMANLLDSGGIKTRDVRGQQSYWMEGCVATWELA